MPVNAFLSAHAALHRLRSQVPSITSLQATVAAFLVDKGPRSMGELSRELGVSAHSMTGVVDRLVVLGLVARSPYTPDRRKTVVGPTPKAELIFDEDDDSRGR